MIPQGHLITTGCTTGLCQGDFDSLICRHASDTKAMGKKPSNSTVKRLVMLETEIILIRPGIVLPVIMNKIKRSDLY